MKRDSDRGKQRTRGGKGIVAGGSRIQGEERDSDRGKQRTRRANG